VKKYIIFALSFILLFSFFQVISGMFLTMMYTPNIEKAWELTTSLSQEVVITRNYSDYWLNFLIAFVSASIAYIILNKFSKKENANKVN